MAGAEQRLPFCLRGANEIGFDFSTAGLVATISIKRLQDGRCTEMISNTTGSIDGELTPCQERLKASADCWLSLAAAPTFAIMALLTGSLAGGPLDGLCSAAHGASPLSGMVPMYLLMIVFHSAPWRRLICSRAS
jgi:hypothetical protein